MSKNNEAPRSIYQLLCFYPYMRAVRLYQFISLDDAKRRARDQKRYRLPYVLVRDWDEVIDLYTSAVTKTELRCLLKDALTKQAGSHPSH